MFAHGEAVNANELVESLGARLKAMRLQNGLSQSALAAGLATKSMISQIESGKARPSRQLLDQFAQRLGVGLDDLLPAMQGDQQRHADYRQAQALYMLGHYEQALPLLLHCLEAPHATGSLLMHTQAAFCCSVLKRYEEARDHYEAALREAVREQALAEVVRCHHRLGEVAFARGEWNVALHEWELALRELRGGHAPEDEPELACELLLNLGNVLHRLGHDQEAFRHYREAQREMRARKHPLRKEAAATFGIGVCCFRLKRYQVAQAYLSRAADQFDLARDRRAALEARLELVQLLRVIGQPALALQVLADCGHAARGMGESELCARIVCERAVIWQEQGRQTEAVEGLAEALRRWSKKSFCGKGVVHLRLADLYAEGQRYEAALQEAECAAADLAEEGQHGELLKAYQLLTRLHKRFGDYKRASECVVKVNELMNRQIRGVGMLA